jgi:hypothetical protein
VARAFVTDADHTVIADAIVTLADVLVAFGIPRTPRRTRRGS